MSHAPFVAALVILLHGCVPCTPERCCEASTPETELSTEARYRAIAEQNLCPDGVPFLQSTWRFIGQSGTPDFEDHLSIEGTRFVEHLSGRPGGGERVDARLEGEVRCIKDNRILVRVDTVTPAGAFGNRAGDAYPCDVLQEISGRSQRMLLMCFFDWDFSPSAGREFEYQRVTR